MTTQEMSRLRRLLDEVGPRQWTPVDLQLGVPASAATLAAAACIALPDLLAKIDRLEAELHRGVSPRQP
jgi:hypothetical protein